MDSLEKQRNEAEKKAIADALKANAGHRTAAAADLGITERTLYRKLRKYPPLRNLGLGGLGGPAGDVDGGEIEGSALLGGAFDGTPGDKTETDCPD